MKNVLQIARELSTKLQGLGIAKADLMLLNQAIKDGRPGLLTDAVMRCRKWEHIAVNRTNTITRHAKEAQEKRFEARLWHGLVKQAEPLFPFNPKDFE